MTRRRGRPVHGWVVLDKPVGMSSAHAVAKVRRLFDAAKAGHAGTLDPLASGVLPIALGEATKTVGHVVDRSKSYRFTVRWGEERDTDDSEGTVTTVSARRPTTDEIRAALPGFTGVITQVPPAYSAVKVAGERAYALARANVPAALSPRRVVVESLVLVDADGADHAVFELRCGKGTYVRGLARDLARALATTGHVAEIRRTASGPFDIGQAISLERLAALGHSAPPLQHLLPIETALDDIPALALSDVQAGYLQNGRPVRMRSGAGLSFVDLGELEDGDLVCAVAGGRPVALARLAGEELQPVRVLKL